MLKPSAKIYLADSKISKAGRGVFAAVKIKAGEAIEVCPVIAMSKEDTAKAKETELKNYYFMWGEGRETEKAAVCLGFGSLFNHSYEPNATYKKRIAERLIDFVAIKDIQKGEEITVNYNYGDPDDKKTLWIKSIEPYG